jgi:peptidoglycan/LPS O-acetylase OafA/YrhL
MSQTVAQGYKISAPLEKSSRRIPSLDGLRAISILAVLLGHVAFSCHFESWITHAYAHYGVLVFFVISGYLITRLLLEEESRFGRISLSQFYLRRTFRIFPVAYLYLLAMIPFVTIAGWKWVLVWLYGATYVPDLPWNLSHLWSLSVEEQFYLVWPLALVASRRHAKKLAWLAILTAVIMQYVVGKGLSVEINPSFFFPCVMDSVAAGSLLALYRPQLPRISPLWWLLLLVAPLISHASVIQTGWPVPQLFTHLSTVIFDVLVAVLIVEVTKYPPRWLNSPILVWIGTLSYSLYVWQMPFLNPAYKINPAIAVLLVFAAASLSYYFWERPILKWSQKFVKRRVNKPAWLIVPTARAFESGASWDGVGKKEVGVLSVEQLSSLSAIQTAAALAASRSLAGRTWFGKGYRRRAAGIRAADETSAIGTRRTRVDATRMEDWSRRFS